LWGRSSVGRPFLFAKFGKQARPVIFFLFSYDKRPHFYDKILIRPGATVVLYGRPVNLTNTRPNMKQILPLWMALLFICLAQNSRAQSPHLDSLKQKVERYDRQAKQKRKDAFSLADSARVRLLHNIASDAMFERPDTAAAYARKVLALSEKIGFKKGKGWGYGKLAVATQIMGNPKRALTYYDKAIQIYLEVGEKRELEETYVNLSILYANSNNYLDAIKTAQKALTIAKDRKDLETQAAVYNNIGLFCDRKGNAREAIDYYRKCLAITNTLHDDRMGAMVNTNIGRKLLDLHKLGEARQYLATGLALAEKGPYAQPLAHNYESTGILREREGNWQGSLDCQLKALEFWKEVGDPRAIAHSMLFVGQAYVRNGQPQKAAPFFEEGLSMAQQGGDFELIGQGHLGLSDVYAAKGNYRQAYESYKRFKQANDSVFNAEKESAFNNLRMRYDFKSVQDSIRGVQQQRDFEDRRRRATNNFIFIALGLTVLFLVVLIIQRNKIARIRRQQALDEERNRLRRYLHDNLGAQLSTVRMYLNSFRNKTQINEKNVSDTVGLLDESIAELRRIMSDDTTSQLSEKGLIAATEMLVTKIGRLQQVSFSLSHHGMENRVPQQVEHELFRILQELVNNTLKYAGAQNIGIEFIRRDGKLILMYEDDGSGFDPETVQRGNGLHNIGFRAQAMHGSATFESSPGQGSQTIIEIPC